MAFLNATAGAGKVARIVCTAAARPVCSRTAKADRESTRRSTYDQLPVTEVNGGGGFDSNNTVLPAQPCGQQSRCEDISDKHKHGKTVATIVVLAPCAHRRTVP